MKTFLLVASLAVASLPFLHGAPPSKDVAPATRPAVTKSAALPAGTCGRILVREPGRKAPRLAECSATACARNTACFKACGH